MKIKKILVGVAAGAILLASTTAPVFAKAEKLNFGSQLNASQCNTSATPVINVTQQILNDADSGQAGNYWALDNFNRTIQVWDQGGGNFCAIVRYEGSFNAIAGQTTPGNGGSLSGTETGTIEGGYQAAITGATLKVTPAWPTQGNVGTTDYQCDSSGNCLGAFSWPGQYFQSGYGFSQPWWGWIYRNGNHVWVNASTGNSGDVL